MLFQRHARTISWLGSDGISRRKHYREMAAPATDAIETPVKGDIRALIAQQNLIRALEKDGLPFVEGATPEEELVELLKGAIEIEHGLMIQYLYASYASRIPAIAGAINGIAVEEMGHLLTVLNLLLAMGDKPYLGRYDHQARYFDPFPFKLEPIDFTTIAKYATCEMPDPEELDPEDKEVIEELIGDAIKSTGGLTPERVGLLYLKIYWLLRETDDPLPNPTDEEWPGYPVEKVAAIVAEQHGPKFHVASFPMMAPLLQGQHDDWNGSNLSIIIKTAENRHAAREGVSAISAQGEGFGAVADGHFDRFVTSYKLAKTAGDISHRVATNPWYDETKSLSTDPAAKITSAISVQFAKLGDMLYEVILHFIALGIHPDQKNVNRRSEIAGHSIDLMRIPFRTLGNVMRTLPLQDNENIFQLSFCFSLPDSPNEFEEIRAKCRQLHEAAIQICNDLEQVPDLDVDQQLAVLDIRDFLQNSVSII